MGCYGSQSQQTCHGIVLLGRATHLARSCCTEGEQENTWAEILAWSLFSVKIAFWWKGFEQFYEWKTISLKTLLKKVSSGNKNGLQGCLWQHSNSANCFENKVVKGKHTQFTVCDLDRDIFYFLIQHRFPNKLVSCSQGISVSENLCLTLSYL